MVEPGGRGSGSDRAHRIGQDRPVTVYRLIARGTIEDKILALHADKRALIAGVLDGTSAAARLTTRDLLALIASGPAPRAAEPPDDLSDDMLGGLRDTAVTRLFLDPEIDPDSGDVHGQILRLAPLT